jgi:hypothetical protein
MEYAATAFATGGVAISDQTTCLAEAAALSMSMCILHNGLSPELVLLVQLVFFHQNDLFLLQVELDDRLHSQPLMR